MSVLLSVPCGFSRLVLALLCLNIIIIIYSIYRALIPNGPKALYIIKNNDKILNLQNYIVIL